MVISSKHMLVNMHDQVMGCDKLNLCMLLRKRQKNGRTGSGFIQDKKHLESVIGKSNESWFEELTAKKIQSRKVKDEGQSVRKDRHPLTVFDSPSCSPSFSQLIQNHLEVGSSPVGLRHSSPAPYCNQDESFNGRRSLGTPQSADKWERPSLGLSPGQSPITLSRSFLSHPSGSGVQSLGLDNSPLSWTNSLATPAKNSPQTVSEMVTSMKDNLSVIKLKETARELFSPGNRLDSTGDSLLPLDSTFEDDQSDLDGSVSHKLETDQTLRDENHASKSITNVSRLQSSNASEMQEKAGIQNMEVNAEETCGTNNSPCIPNNKSISSKLQIETVQLGEPKHMENWKESFNKRILTEKGVDTVKRLKSCESVAFGSDTSKQNETGSLSIDLKTNEATEENNDECNLSPTFSQKSSSRKAKLKFKKNESVPSSQTNDSVRDVLCDFFDSPSSTVDRRRPAPGRKRKSQELEGGVFEDCDSSTPNVSETKSATSSDIMTDKKSSHCSTPDVSDTKSATKLRSFNISTSTPLSTVSSNMTDIKSSNCSTPKVSDTKLTDGVQSSNRSACTPQSTVLSGMTDSKSSKSCTNTPHSILSSSKQRRDSSNKKVRFSDSVERCSYLPENSPIVKGRKSVERLNNKKPLMKRMKLDETLSAKAYVSGDTVTDKTEKNSSGKPDKEISGESFDLKLSDSEQKLVKEKTIGKVSCINGVKETFASDGHDSNLKQSGQKERIDVGEKIDHNEHKHATDHTKISSVTSDLDKSVEKETKSPESETKKGHNVEELFSQISPGALSEMCNEAEKSKNIKNENIQKAVTIVHNKSLKSPGNITPKLTAVNKFFYPSVNQKQSSASKVFRFEEATTSSSAKKALLKAVTVTDVLKEKPVDAEMVTEIEKTDRSTETNLKTDPKQQFKKDIPITVPYDKAQEKTDECLIKYLKIDQGTPSFAGFHSAGGKKVQASDQSLKKAESLLKDDSAVNKSSPVIVRKGQNTVKNDTLLNSSKPMSVIGSKTSFHKTSTAKTSETKENFSDKYKPQQSNQKKSESLLTFEDKVDSKLCGFQSASGKSFNIPPKALAQAAELLQDDKTRIHKSVPVNTTTKSVSFVNEVLSAVNQNTAGFQCASGKALNIPQKALELAANLFQENIDAVHCIPYTSNTSFVKANGDFADPESFKHKTRRHNLDIEEMEFSEWPDEDVEPDENIVFDIEDLETSTSDHNKDRENRDNKLENAVSSEMVGESEHPIKSQVLKEESCPSVNNGLKDVTVDNSLNVKKFNDEDHVNSDVTYQKTKYCDQITEISSLPRVDKLTLYNSVNSFQGFQMASGKNVVVNREKLKEAESFLNTYDNKVLSKEVGFEVSDRVNKTEKNSGLIGNVSNYTSTCVQSAGFTSANGKAVMISVKSLQDAQNLIDRNASKTVDIDFLNGKNSVQNSKTENRLPSHNFTETLSADFQKTLLQEFEASESLEDELDKMLKLKNVKQNEIKQPKVNTVNKTVADIGKRSLSKKFPPGANVPQGFRPFKPLKVNKSLQGVKYPESKLKDWGCESESHTKADNVKNIDVGNKSSVKDIKNSEYNEKSDGLSKNIPSGKSSEHEKVVTKVQKKTIFYPDSKMKSWDTNSSEKQNNLVMDELFENNSLNVMQRTINQNAKLKNINASEKAEQNGQDKFLPNTELNNADFMQGMSQMFDDDMDLPQVNTMEQDITEDVEKDYLKADINATEIKIKCENFSKAYTSAGVNGITSEFNELQRNENDFRNSVSLLGVKDAVIGFKTAAGKSLAISESAARAAEKMLLEGDDQLDQSRKKNNEQDSKVISEERGVCKQEETTFIMQRETKQGVYISSVQQFQCGFQTASGQSIALSKAALELAANRFHVDNEESKVNVEYEQIITTGSFQNAERKLLEDAPGDLGNRVKHLANANILLNLKSDVHIKSTNVLEERLSSSLEESPNLGLEIESSSVTNYLFHSGNGKLVESHDEEFNKTEQKVDNANDLNEPLEDHVVPEYSGSETVQQNVGNENSHENKLSLCLINKEKMIELGQALPNISDRPSQVCHRETTKEINANDFVVPEMISPQPSTSSYNGMQDVKKTLSETNKLGTEQIYLNQIVSESAKEISSANFEIIAPKPNFLGFSTASGKKVTISEQALAIAKEKLDSNEILDIENVKLNQSKNGVSVNNVKELNDSKSNHTMEFTPSSKEESNEFQNKPVIKSGGLSTSSIAKMSISEEALNHAKKQIEENIEFQNKPVPKFDGFRTASGAKIGISEEGLKHAKGQLEESFGFQNKPVTNFDQSSTDAESTITLSDQILTQSGNQFEDNGNFTKKPVPKFSGFSTASGLKVSVSEKALKLAKGRFKENSVFENKQVSKSGNASGVMMSTLDTKGQLKEAVPKFGGFSSASGSEVTISEQALRDAKCQIEDSTHFTDNPAEIFSGFSTASGSKVRISDQALKHAKEQLDDIDDFANKSDPKFGGFRTALGTKVIISEEAVRRAKGQLEDNAASPDESVHKFSRFATASGEEVNISEQAIRHAEAQLDNISACPDKSVSKFGGFCTASGSKVSISEQALKHAKAQLEDIQTLPEESVSKFDGFSTASGSKVSISEHALKHAKAKLEDIPTLSDESVSKFGGFSTASGSKVSISEQALKHAKAKLEDIQTLPVESVSKIGGFCTASGLKVIISEKALSHAKGQFENDTALPVEQVPKFGGICTASGSKVSVSEQALRHAKGQLEDIPDFPDESALSFGPFCTASGSKVSVSEQALRHAKGKLEDVLDLPDEQVPKFGGFSTASGSKVSVSEQALRHAKGKLEDVPDLPDEQVPKFGGFCTASGSKVSVSEQALRHAKGKLEDVPDLPDEQVPKFGGFSTASGSKVSVSEQALRHAKGKLEDIADLPDEPAPKFVGFSTASGSKVSVSEQALRHAKGKLEDIADLPDEPAPKFGGFSTASGSKVSVSEQALRHAKGQLDESATISNIPKFDGLSSHSLSEISFSDGTQGRNGREGYNSTACSLRTQDSELLTKGCSKRSNESTNVALNMIETDVPESDMEDMFGLALKRRKLEMNKERFTVQKPNETDGFSTLKRKALTTTPEGLTTDRRHPGFKPFKPVFCRSLEGRRKISDIQPALTAPTKQPAGLKPSFQTPYKSTPEKSTTSTPTSSNEFNGLSFKSTAPVFIPKSGLVSAMGKGDGNDRRLEKIGTISADFSYTGVFNAKVTASGDNANKLVCKTKPTVNSVSCFGKSKEEVKSSKKLDALTDITKDTIQGSTESDTGIVTNTKVNLESKANISVHKSNNAVTNEYIDKSDVDDNETGKATSKPGHHSEMEKKSGANEVANFNRVEQEPEVMEADFDSFSQEEDDVYYCMLVEARKHQEDIIKQRGASRVKPMAGRLWKMKQTQGRWKLAQVIDKLGQGLPHQAVNITSESSKCYKFSMEAHYGKNVAHVLVGDGAYLVPDDAGKIGKEEFYRAFLTMDGVDRKLISESWVYNHYRWIVWKLAAYENRSSCLHGRCLTPEMVMLQLKYRYDKEVDLSQRSSLQKIYERDDTASKRMVLCVAAIRQHTLEDSSVMDNSKSSKDNKIILELTDGWYSIPAQIDVPLSQLVCQGQITVGQKLCVTGAELVGGDDACTPLEAPASVMLKISRNATRPATWDSNLGYQSDPRPLCVPICGLHGEGGIVGVLDVVIVRKYPIMYMEKLESGGCIFRTSRCEDRARQEYDSRKQTEMEKIYRQMENMADKDEKLESRSVRSKKFSRTELENLQTGQDIYEALEVAAQPDMAQNYLSDEQMAMLYEYKRQIQEEKQSEMNSKFQRVWQEQLETFPERNVTPVLKFRVAGCANKDLDHNTSTIVTVWRPSPEISDLQEGHRYKIYSLATSVSRSKYTGHTVQLTATKQTRYRRMELDENVLDNIYESREVLWVSDIKRRQPPYGELDFVGMIVKIAVVNVNERSCETVYLADCQTGVLAVRFWNGFKSFGEDMFREGTVLCCSNLMDKSSYRNQHVPTVEATTEFTQISNKPQNSSQRKAIEKLNSSAKDKKAFTAKALSVLESTTPEKLNQDTPKRLKEINDTFLSEFSKKTKRDSEVKDLQQENAKSDMDNFSSDDSFLKTMDVSMDKTNNSSNTDTLANVEARQSADNESNIVDTSSIETGEGNNGIPNLNLNDEEIPGFQTTNTTANYLEFEGSEMTSTPNEDPNKSAPQLSVEELSFGIKRRASNNDHELEGPEMTSTPVVNRKRSLAQLKLAKLMTYGSPSVLSPLNTSVPKSVSRGFKPPAFKKL